MTKPGDTGPDPRREPPSGGAYGPAAADPGMAILGMRIFLAALGVLFAASLFAFLYIRLRSETWTPAEMPRLPRGLWISTILMLASSGTMHAALRGARLGRRAALRLGLAFTLALGVAFLFSQTVNWFDLVRHESTLGGRRFLFTFILLPGLHGAHVIGGLVPMSVATFRAFRGRYSVESHTGVRLCAMYWHFLDGVWLVMFALMLLAA